MKTESTRRQMAEEIAAKWDAYANLVDAIEDILKDRDERAAKICEYYQEEDGDIASQSAAAIRGSKD